MGQSNFRNNRKNRIRNTLVGSLMGVMSILPGVSGAQDLVLEDYLSTKTAGTHLSVNGDLPDNFINISDSLTWINDNLTSAPFTVHVYANQDGYNNGGANFMIPANTTLVGHRSIGGSVVPFKFEGDVVDALTHNPSSAAATITEMVEMKQSNSKLVNFLIKTESSESFEIDNASTITLFNNFVEGGQGNNYTGLTVGPASSNISVINNVFNDLYISRFPNIGTAISISGDVNLKDNVFANSPLGLRGYDTSDMDLGTVENHGGNVFYGNVLNIKAEIGDVDLIPAIGNTWYPVVAPRTAERGVAGGVAMARDGSYIPLQIEQEIKDTILILNPSARTSENHALNGMLEDLETGLPSVAANMAAQKGVVIYPWNNSDPLERFEYQYEAPKTAGVSKWMLWE